MKGINSQAWRDSLRLYKQAEQEYFVMFGAESLDYVNLWDPLHVNSDDLVAGARKLLDAVKTGRPLDNTPPNPDMPEIIY